MAASTALLIFVWSVAVVSGQVFNVLPWQGKLFMHNTVLRTYADTVNLCSSVGAKIPTFDSTEDLDVVGQHFNKYHIWLSVSHRSNSTNNKYFWNETSRGVNRDLWCPGEPSCGHGCGAVYGLIEKRVCLKTLRMSESHFGLCVLDLAPTKSLSRDQGLDRLESKFMALNSTIHDRDAALAQKVDGIGRALSHLSQAIVGPWIELVHNRSSVPALT